MAKRNQQIVKTTYSFADRFVLAVANVLNDAAAFLLGVSVIYCFWIGWAFTGKLRELLDNAFWSLLVYVVATALVFAIGFYWSSVLPRLTVGRPVFGKLGGLPVRTFEAAIRATAQINVELFQSDQPLAKRFNEIHMRVLHDTLKARFEQIKQDKDTHADRLSDEWPEIWNKEVLEMTFDGQSFGEAADVNKFGINLAIPALLRSTLAIPLLASLFWIIMVFLIYMCANQQLAILTGFQASIVLAFVLAAFWYMFVLHNLSSLALTFKTLELPELTRKEFADDIETLEASEIRIKRIQVKKKFYQIVRNYQLRLLLGGVLTAITILLLLHGTSFGVLYLIDAEYARSVSSYHAAVTYGVLIAGSILVLGFYVFSLVLENFRRISAALVAAVLSAGLPFLIDFVLGGQLDISGAQQAIFAGSGGLTVALVTAITSNVKESME